MLARIILVLAGSLLMGQGSRAGMTLIGSIEGKRFYSTLVGMNYYQAKDYCQEYGFQLATIESQEEQDVIEQIAHKKPEAIEWSAFWLGGMYNSTSSQWVWENGSPLTFSNWENGMAPDSMMMMMYGSSCVSVKVGKYQGTWTSNQCEYPLGTVHPLCMLDTGSVPSSSGGNDSNIIPSDPNPNPEDNSGMTTSVPAPPAFVPKEVEGMQYIGRSQSGETSKQYYANFATSTWYEAKEACQAKGLKLASFETEADGVVLDQWYAEDSSYHYLWVAGTESSMSEWMWADSGNRIALPGETGYQDWAYQNPYRDQYTSGTLCMYVVPGYYWYSYPCAWSGVPSMCMLEE